MSQGNRAYFHVFTVAVQTIATLWLFCTMQCALFKLSGGTEQLTNIHLPHLPMAKALKGAILEFSNPTG